MRNLNIRCNSGTVVSTFQDLNVGEDFLSQTPVSQEMGPVVNKWDPAPHKMKNLLSEGND